MWCGVNLNGDDNDGEDDDEVRLMGGDLILSDRDDITFYT